MSDSSRREAAGLSRRGLLGLGLARVAPDAPAPEPAELPAVARDPRAWARETWSGGDHDAWAALLRPASEGLVSAAGVAPGDRALDVGAGTGNVALAAAACGAQVSAVDLVDVAVTRGRERSEAAGAEVDWQAGDVDALPYGDDTFDVVTSAFGAMFALRRERALSELFRVVRPGGVVALASWTSGGVMGRLLRLALSREPAPAGAPFPGDWGRSERMRQDLEHHVDGFDEELHRLPLTFATAGEAWETLSSAPGPLGAARRALDGTELNVLRDEVVSLVETAAGEPGQGLELRLAYLVTIARTSRR